MRVDVTVIVTAFKYIQDDPLIVMYGGLISYIGDMIDFYK